MKGKTTILSVCGACVGVLTLAWLLGQINQLKVQARELEAALDQQKPLPVFSPPITPATVRPAAVERVVRIQGSEPIEIGDVMTKLQRHANKLYFAGEHRNWDLAAFYLEEIEETVKGVANKDIMEGQVNISGLMQGLLVPEIETLEEKLQYQEHGAFREQYGRLLKACNACHDATKHEYIRIIEPRTPIFDNQMYDPVPAAPTEATAPVP